MKYLLLICDRADSDLTPEEWAAVGPATEAWVAEMDGRGIRLDGDRLARSTDATTVRVVDDEIRLTDGPYAEAKEQMAGYDILECASLDEAIEVASKHPMARAGQIEVRPFWTE